MRTANPIRWWAFAALLLSGSLRADQSTPAQEAIPFASLSATNQVLIKGVTDHYTLRRAYPPQRLTVTTAQLEWMLDHLHATWQLAREFGLNVRCARPDSQGRLWNDNGDDAKGYIMPVYSAPGKRIYYMEGSQKKVWTVHGRGVVVIDYVETKPGTINVSGAQFIRVDNAMMAAITQLCGPLLCGMVDKVYAEFTAPLGKLGATAATAPQALREAIGRLPTEEAAKLSTLLELLGPAPLATNSRPPATP